MKKMIFMVLIALFLIPLTGHAEVVMVSDLANAWTTTEYYPASGYTNAKKYDRFNFTVTADSLADSAWVYVEVSDNGTDWFQACAAEEISAERASIGAGLLDFTVTGVHPYIRLTIIGATSGDTFNVYGVADRAQQYNSSNY